MHLLGTSTDMATTVSLLSGVTYRDAMNGVIISLGLYVKVPAIT